jgi:hypothetical protein
MEYKTMENDDQSTNIDDDLIDTIVDEIKKQEINNLAPNIVNNNNNKPDKEMISLIRKIINTNLGDKYGNN